MTYLPTMPKIPGPNPDLYDNYLKVNRLIIIGNGFDLAHGLKTSFKEFIEDLEIEMPSTSRAIPVVVYEQNLIDKKRIIFILY